MWDDSHIRSLLLSAKANRMIGGDAPSVYLAKIQKHPQVKIDDDSMNARLVSHRIPVDAIRTDDFEAFHAARKQALLGLIESVTGKVLLGGGYDETEDDDEEQISYLG